MSACQPILFSHDDGDDAVDEILRRRSAWWFLFLLFSHNDVNRESDIILFSCRILCGKVLFCRGRGMINASSSALAIKGTASIDGACSAKKIRLMSMAYRVMLGLNDVLPQTKE